VYSIVLKVTSQYVVITREYDAVDCSGGGGGKSPPLLPQ